MTSARSRPRPSSGSKTFADLLRKHLPKSTPPDRPLCHTPKGRLCRICPSIGLEYEKELTAKEAAFREFLTLHPISGNLHPLIRSPKPRRYRTVSKRRSFFRGETLLGLTDFVRGEGSQPMNVLDCPIEPEIHSRMYRHVQGFLFRSRALSDVLHYCIIKGSYDKLAVLFSVRHTRSGIRSLCNDLSKSLTRQFPSVSGVFTIEDKRSSYYLSDQAERMNKLFGEEYVSYQAGEEGFRFSPVSFSQTNLSILPEFVRRASELMELRPDDRIWDLYCGWGLFGLSMARRVASVTGVDYAGESIRAAKENARRSRLKNCHFHECPITAERMLALSSRLPAPTKIFLDPPRSGTSSGVIRVVASRKPERIVHAFCNVDTMPDELQEWRRCGYEVREIVPVDMFPATALIEVMVVLGRT